MDFEKYNIQQPTYINVIRDPADWFQSHYYFERFGWTRKEDDRGSFSGSDEDKQRVNFPPFFLNLKLILDRWSVRGTKQRAVHGADHVEIHWILLRQRVSMQLEIWKRWNYETSDDEGDAQCRTQLLCCRRSWTIRWHAQTIWENAAEIFYWRYRSLSFWQ